MIKNEIISKIINACYDQWFNDYILGIDIRNLITDDNNENEVKRHLEFLITKYVIRKNDYGRYVITDAGIDLLEEFMTPSDLSKIKTERKQILNVLKEPYEKDIHEYIPDEFLKESLNIGNHVHLLGTVVYFRDKGLVDLEILNGGAFYIRLTENGYQSFSDVTFSTVDVMKNAYARLFNIENQLRKFIEDKLIIKYGPDWWNKGLSAGLKAKTEDRKETELKEAWKVAEIKSNMDYLSFEHLSGVIITNWNGVFDMIFYNQDKIKLKLTELETIRNAIAHCRTLSDDSLKKIQMYSDEIKQMIS